MVAFSLVGFPIGAPPHYGGVSCFHCFRTIKCFFYYHCVGKGWEEGGGVLFTSTGNTRVSTKSWPGLIKPWPRRSKMTQGPSESIWGHLGALLGCLDSKALPTIWPGASKRGARYPRSTMRPRIALTGPADSFDSLAGPAHE